MLYLLLIHLLLFLVLAALLWGGTQLVQGMLYEEPPTQLVWRAPAAAGALTAFFLLWCLLNYAASAPGSTDTPYTSLFNLSTNEQSPPVPEFQVIRPNAAPVRYRLRKSAGARPVAEYYDDNSTKFGDVQAREAETIVIKEGDKETRFKRQADATGPMDEGRRWREEDGKRVFTEDGRITTPRAGRSVMTVILNVLHLGVWFACLWLLLRFQWPHALGLALVLWVAMTFALPVLFDKVPTKPAAESRAALRAGRGQVATP